MKVLLVRPSWKYPFTEEEATYNRIWSPLELATSGAMLEESGHSVSILDAHALRLQPEEVSLEAETYDKVFLSSSSYDRWQCPNVNIAPFLETAKEIRSRNENLYVLGYHGTVRPEEILELTKAKAVVRGEPELTVRELCEHDKLSQIEGITYCRDGKVFSNEDRPLLNMEDLPPPALHLLDTELYFYEPLGKSFALFEGARGCPYKCSFCVLTMFGNKYCRKSPEKVIHEVDAAIRESNVKTGYFIDLEFTVYRRLVGALCEHLIRKDYDFTWACQTRPDSVDREMLNEMKRAKCKLIHFGVESGSDRVLASVNKRTTVRKIEAGVRMAKEAGIRVMCFFLLGLPGEQEEDIKETIKFAKRLNPHYASFHIVLPYPDTKLYESTNTPNEREDIKRGLFPVDFDREIPLSHLRKLMKKAVLNYYLRPSYMVMGLRSGTFSSPLKLLKIFLNRLK